MGRLRKLILTACTAAVLASCSPKQKETNNVPTETEGFNEYYREIPESTEEYDQKSPTIEESTEEPDQKSSTVEISTIERIVQHTIGHRVLDEEKELGSNEQDYEILEQIINETQKRIQKKPVYNKNDAIKILKTIDSVLTTTGFSCGEDAIIFNKGLKEKVIDCSDYSLIYLSIGEALGLPLTGVDAPEHMFVRWHLNEKDYFNWETTCGQECDDDYYIKEKNISSKLIKDGIYLRSLSQEESFALRLSEIGTALHYKGEHDKAIEYYTRAIEINPNVPAFYQNRGNTWIGKWEFNRAIADFDEAIRLYPGMTKAHIARVLTYTAKYTLISTLLLSILFIGYKGFKYYNRKRKK